MVPERLARALRRRIRSRPRELSQRRKGRFSTLAQRCARRHCGEVGRCGVSRSLCSSLGASTGVNHYGLCRILGFLASAAVLAFYAKGWQVTPAREALDKAVMTFSRSPAARAFNRTMTSATHRKLQLAADRSHNEYSPTWKALTKFQNQCSQRYEPFTRRTSKAARSEQSASSFWRTRVLQHRRSRRHLRGDRSLVPSARLHHRNSTTSPVASRSKTTTGAVWSPLGISAIVLVIGVFAYRAFQQIPPGAPSESEALRHALDGDFRYWAAIVFPRVHSCVDSLRGRWWREADSTR